MPVPEGYLRETMFDEMFRERAGDEHMDSLNEVFGRLHEMGKEPAYFRVDVVYHEAGRPRRTDGQVAVIATDGVDLLCGWPQGKHPRITDPLHWQRFEELRAKVEPELPQVMALIGGPVGNANGDGYDRAEAAYTKLLKPIRNRYFTLEVWGLTLLTGQTLPEALDDLKNIWTR